MSIIVDSHDSATTAPEIGSQKLYAASSPRMVFPSSDSSYSESGRTDRPNESGHTDRPKESGHIDRPNESGCTGRPSKSSLFFGRYNDRASTSYVPLHEKGSNHGAEQTPIFFAAISSPTDDKDSLVDKGSVPKAFSVEKGRVPINTEKLGAFQKGSVSLFDPYYRNDSHLDTSTDPRGDPPYSGFTQHYLWHRYKRPLVTRSIFDVPRQNKEDYGNDMWYPCNHFPPAKYSIVEESPTREKKTEPVQDPVPRVKGIRGTPPKFCNRKEREEERV